jgi:hypothetical protein
VVRRGADGPIEVVEQRRLVVDDLHGAAAEHVRRPDQHGVADTLGDRTACSTLVAMPLGGTAAPMSRQSAAKRSRSSARSIWSTLVPRMGTPSASSGFASLSGVWPPSWTMTPRPLPLDDLEHVLERERLEVELVADVEVGRDGLRIRVDHDRLVAVVAQRERGLDAAVVELDALPDAVGPAAEDDDLARSVGGASVSCS